MDLKGKYGLIIPAKEREAKAAAVPQVPARKRNVFGDDESDSEPDEDTDWVKKTMKKQSHGSVQQKQSVQAIKQALADDPSVYQYDELYDDMEKKRESTKEEKKKDRNPKYIGNLLKTAEKRKQEDEARNERLVQKEREKEGDMYKDKEAFVTGAYRKKMEELEKVKEEEQRRDALDALVDVTKQNDLSGFYRHLYRQQIQEPEDKLQTTESSENTDDPVVKSEPASPKPEGTAESQKTPERETVLFPKEERDRTPESKRRRSRSPKRERDPETDRHRNRRDRSRRDRSRDEDRGSTSKRSREDSHENRDRRSYRDRSRSRDKRRDRSSGGRRDRSRDRRRDRSRERRRNYDNNDDKGRDRHRDRSRDRGRKDRYQPKVLDSLKPETSGSPETVPDKKVKLEMKSNPEVKSEDANEAPEVKSEDANEAPEVKSEDANEAPEVKSEDANEAEPKVSIWTKRTIGTVFDEALSRYFARKQANTLQASIVVN